MEEYDLPIFIHPMFPTPTCATMEGFNQARIFMGPKADNGFAMHRTLEITMGTTFASTRLVMSHLFDKHPRLKFILHHGGSFIPYMSQRLVLTQGTRENIENVDLGLNKPLLDYYKMFYVDTALHGNVPALMCSQDFFGTDHMLFGTDFPFDGEQGKWSIQTNIDQIEESGLSSEDKAKVYEKNAREFFHLQN
jgi:aminocarboxymuconate-semialdehyde decarboxylase